MRAHKRAIIGHMQWSEQKLSLMIGICAAMILLSQSWYIAWGIYQAQPITMITGHSLAAHAGMTLFGLLGFLLAYKLDKSDDIFIFCVACFLRVVPAYIVALIMLFFVMLPALLQISPLEFLSIGENWFAIARIGLLFDSSVALPGLLYENNVAGIIHKNIELFGIGFLCVISLFLSFQNIKQAFYLSLINCFLFIAILVVGDSFETLKREYFALYKLAQYGLCFYIGVLLFTLRNSLKFDPLLVIAIGYGAILFSQQSSHMPLLCLFNVYLGLWIAFQLPVLNNQNYDHVNISLGLLLYGWPLQQIIEHSHQFISPAALALLSITAVGGISVLSYLWIEQPSTRFANRFSDWLSKPNPQTVSSEKL